MKKLEKINIVYVDFDGTLVSTNSIKYLFFIRKNIWLQSNSLKDLLAYFKIIGQIPYLSILHLTNATKRDKYTYAQYKGISCENMKRVSSLFWKTHNRSVICENLVSLLKMYKKKGYKIIIVSGSIRQIIESCLEIFRISSLIDNIICAELVEKKNLITGQLKNKPMIHENKLKAVKKYEQENFLTVKNRIGITDSISDLPILSIATKKIAVNPDKKLFKLAKAENWPIVRF